jgi:ADP-heptose:LPS heptosyltransferase
VQTIRTDQRDPIPQGGRVAIFRALPGLGDLLTAVPALRALRRSRPDAEVTYVGMPSTEALVRRYPSLVDEFIAFPGFPGLPDQRPDLAAIPRFLEAAQAKRFDLAVQLHGSGRITNTVVALLGARRIAGHHVIGDEIPDRALFMPWIERCSEVRRGLRLMAHLGWPSDDETLAFDVAPGTTSPVADGPPYVVVHAGASTPARRWSAAGFGEVADALAATGHRIVLTGTPDERTRNERIAEGLTTEPIDLTGRTTLDELGETIRRAALVVSNDTGVAHLAVALRTPSVVVFTGSDPVRWSPLDPTRHRAVPGSARRVLAEARRMLASVQVPHAA